MEIAVSGTSLSFPRMCACCGEANDTVFRVSHSVRYGNRRTTYNWDLPYCQHCVSHTRMTHGKTLEGLLTLFTAGLFIIVFFLVVRPLRLRKARSMMKPSCAAPTAPTFTGGAGASRFQFGSQKFARAFATLNRQHLIQPSPELMALLPRSA